MALEPKKGQVVESLLVQIISPVEDEDRREPFTQGVAVELGEALDRLKLTGEIIYISVQPLPIAGTGFLQIVGRLYPLPDPVEVEGDEVKNKAGPIDERPPLNNRQRRAERRKKKRKWD